MRVGRKTSVVTAVLGVVISLIAKDLMVPLAGVAFFGLIERLLATPVFRSR